MSTLAEFWGSVTSAQPLPPLWLVLATGAVSLAASMHDPTWRILRSVVTIAHEGGHALVAVSTGRRLTGILLHSDTSGVTVSKGKPTGAGVIATAAAGYLTPPLLGLGAALLIAAGHVTGLLWMIMLALAAILTAIRNVFGVVSVLVTGAAVVVVSWWAAADIQAAFAYLFTWFLLFAGIRPTLELHRKRRRGRAPDSDADQLARLTGVPGIAWVGLFVAVAVAAVIVGVHWLVPISASDFPNVTLD